MKKRTNGKGDRTVWHVVRLVAIFAILASLSMTGKGRIFGHKLSENEGTSAVTELPGGQLAVNTTEPGKAISGYAGPVPLTVYVTDGRIDSVSPLPNEETPGFFRRVAESGLLESWNGKTLAEADTLTVDAVSGATFSSKAVIGNVRSAAALLLAEEPATAGGEGWTLKSVITLLIIFCAAILPQFIHNKTYRLVQEIANVAVLGFWTGTFLDYTSMIGFMANPVSISGSAVILTVLMIIGFIYPLFGKEGYYCAWVCPLGSLQELAGKSCRWKLHPGKRTLKGLDIFRQTLWCVLLALLWTGWGAGWIDYELFSGFIVESASTVVLIVGILFILLSVIVPRPFCRFVCPTGTLLK